MAKSGREKKDARAAFGKASSPIQTDVESFLLSASLDRIANYVARGRSFKPLSDAELSDRWIEAFKAMADTPFDEHRRICDAIEAGDAARTHQLVTAHLATVSPMVLHHRAPRIDMSGARA